MFSPTDIAKRLSVRPFTPFRVVTSSGQEYDIRHPEMAIVGRRELVIGLATPDEPRFHDDLSRLALMHITAIVDLPTASPSGGNGRGS